MTQLGIAQKAFFKTHGYIPQPFINQAQDSISDFQFLSSLIENSLLKEIDLIIATYLTQTIKDISIDEKEAIACFLCHLSLASRLGHLCIKVEQEGIIPDPGMSWFNNDNLIDQNPNFSIIRQLHENILIGARSLPSMLLTKVDEHLKANSNSIQSQTLTPIFQSGSFFYFQRQWLIESKLFSNFQAILYMEPAIKLNSSKRLAYIEKLLGEGKLLKEQGDAILKSENNCLSIIFGGPGTGKTYTVGHLIRSYWESLPEENKLNHEIILAAPTGKAASHLAKNIQKPFSDIENPPKFTFKTLHSLLGINPILKNNLRFTSKIHADLVIVDECSMIDVKLMTMLFSAIKPGARLVLLGDPHQLPSVESGTVFTNMIKYIQNLNIPNKMPSTLSTCLRIEIQGILKFANIINHGNADEALRLLNSNSTEGLYRIEVINKKNVLCIQRILLDHSEKYLPKISKSELELKIKQDPISLLDTFQCFRILSPLRNGPLGVNELNQLFLENSLRNMQEWHIAPIIISRNDPHLNLFNGEIGVLITKIDPTFIKKSYHKNIRGNKKIKLQPGDFALFYSLNANGMEEVRKIPALNLNNFEYAYCLSVHKSQGSEFDRVMLIVPDGAEVFGREMLYTAVTRAKKQLLVYCEDDVLKKMIQTPTFRQCSF